MYSGLCYLDTCVQPCEHLCSYESVLSMAFLCVYVGCGYVWGIECECVECFSGCMDVVCVLHVCVSEM